jgi:hypothetical protein
MDRLEVLLIEVANHPDLGQIRDREELLPMLTT